MPATVLDTPAHTTAAEPALAMPAPTSPPISACELDDGMPSRWVIDLPDDRAGQRAEDDAGVDDVRLDDAAADRFGDVQPEHHERR